MKPRALKPQIVYRIIDKESGGACGSYSRACCDEYDFDSVASARSANCHDEFKSKGKYRIAKYRVNYTLIDGDCDKAEGVVDPPIKPVVKAMSDLMVAGSFSKDPVNDPEVQRLQKIYEVEYVKDFIEFTTEFFAKKMGKRKKKK